MKPDCRSGLEHLLNVVNVNVKNEQRSGLRQKEISNKEILKICQMCEKYWMPEGVWVGHDGWSDTQADTVPSESLTPHDSYQHFLICIFLQSILQILF